MTEQEQIKWTADEIKETTSKAGFFQLIGLKVEEAQAGVGRVSIEVDERLYHPMQIVHGGIIFTLADTAMALALLSALPKGTQNSTIEAKINYLKPVRSGILEAEARILHQGRSTAVLEATVCNILGDEHKNIAKVLGTFYLFHPTQDKEKENVIVL